MRFMRAAHDGKAAKAGQTKRGVGRPFQRRCKIGGVVAPVLGCRGKPPEAAGDGGHHTVDPNAVADLAAALSAVPG